MTDAGPNASSDGGSEAGASRGSGWTLEPGLISALAAAVDQTCQQINAFYEFDRPFGELPPPGVSDIMVSWTGIAFYYRLKTDQDKPGVQLEPRHGDEAWPPAINSVDSETIAMWAALADACTHPLAVARFHDLAFVTRTGNGRSHADAAATGYIDASALELDDGESELCALRAWTLARAVQNGPVETRAAARLRELLDAALAQSFTSPTVIELLDALTARTRLGNTPLSGADADTVLTQVRRRLNRPHMVGELARIRRRTAIGDAAALAEIDRDEAQAYLDEAMARDGAVRAMMLDQAAQAARRLNVSEVHDEAVRQLQALDLDTFDWNTDTSETEMPRWAYLFDVLRYTRRRRWQDILAAWCLSSPPTGSYKANLQAVQEDGGSAFLALLPNTHFSQGMPQRTTAGNDTERRLVERESMNAQMQADVLAEVLDTIAKRWGAVDDAVLNAEFLRAWGADPALTRRFARAMGRYLRGDTEGAAYLAFPLAEAGARSFLLAANVPLYRVQFEEKNGSFAGLGAMLDSLAAEGIRDDWTRFLRLLFQADGFNFRNLLAHGAMDDVEKRTAVLLLRAAGLMVSVSSPADLSANVGGTASRRVLRYHLAAAVRAFVYELRAGRRLE